MTLETRLRDQLVAATAHVEGGPDLAVSLLRGRARRRARAIAGAGGVGVTAAAAVTLAVVLPRTAGGPTFATGTVDPPLPHTTPVVSPSGSAEQGFDWIPGSSLDENLLSHVHSYLPDLPAPQSVFCSDVHTAGPIPNDRCGRATDVQAVFSLGTDDTLSLFTGYGPRGEDPGPRGQVQVSQYDSEGHTDNVVSYVFAGGFTVTADEETAPGSDGTQPTDVLRRLVQDQGLVFDAPAGVPVQH